MPLSLKKDDRKSVARVAIEDAGIVTRMNVYRVASQTHEGNREDNEPNRGDNEPNREDNEPNREDNETDREPNVENNEPNDILNPREINGSGRVGAWHNFGCVSLLMRSFGDSVQVAMDV